MSCQDESEYNDLMKIFPFDDTEIHKTKVLTHRIIQFTLTLSGVQAEIQGWVV